MAESKALRGVVVVTGMHRSGTSMMTRIVDLLGVTAGPREGLMPATEANPHGYWEQQYLSEFNERLLERLGGSWADPPPMFGNWQNELLADWRDKAARLLADSFADCDRVVWKDPRLAFLLPFWREVAPIEHKVIVVVRDPDAVAGSLAVRDGFEGDHSARLWLRYVTGALSVAPFGMIVGFGELVERPEVVAAKVAEYLGIGVPEEDTLDLVASSVVPSSVRQKAARQLGRGDWARLARAVFRLTLDAGQHVLMPVVDCVAREMERRGETQRLDQQLQQYKQSVSSLERQVAESTSELARVNHVLEEATAAAEEHRLLACETSRSLIWVRKRVADLEAENASIRRQASLRSEMGG